MSDYLETLLQPSLKTAVPTGALYSVGAHVIVGFFGGPLVLVLFSMWGAFRIRQLNNKLVLYVGCLILALASYLVLIWLLHTGWPELLDLRGTPGKSADLLNTFAALTICGLMYLGLRELFSVGELAHDAPSPMVAGAIAVMVGYITNKALFTIFLGGSV